MLPEQRVDRPGNRVANIVSQPDQPVLHLEQAEIAGQRAGDVVFAANSQLAAAMLGGLVERAKRPRQSPDRIVAFNGCAPVRRLAPGANGDSRFVGIEAYILVPMATQTKHSLIKPSRISFDACLGVLRHHVRPQTAM